jgi:Domain of unknown function (DUF4272)
VFNRRKRESVAPDQDAVVDRVLCLSAVVMLGAIAAGVEDGTMEEAQAAAYVTESHRWLIREQLADALSRRERALIAKPLADWTPEESLAADWRNESAGVLLWALSALDDMPPPDARFEREFSLVPLLAPTTAFRKATSLRPPEEIDGARLAAEQAPHGAGVTERQYALNWLAGRASDWDSVPTGRSS